MPKISALPANTTPALGDLLATVDISDGPTTKKATLSGIFALIYPVGSLYFNATDNTNPATLFGFGTWAAYAAGRVPVGIDSSDTDFDTAGETVGDKTHWHWQTVGSDGNIYAEVNGNGSGHTRGNTLDRSLTSLVASGVGAMREDGTYSASSIQPSVVVYIWRRTA